MLHFHLTYSFFLTGSEKEGFEKDDDDMNANMKTADDGSNSEMGGDDEDGDEFDIVILKNLAAQVRASLVIWKFKEKT